MTKFRVISDLHLEKLGDFKSHISHRDYNDLFVIPKMDGEDEQILLLAGDIVALVNLDRYAPFFDAISKRFKEVYVVMGNHEFWGFDFAQDCVEHYNKFLAQWDNVHLLQNQTAIIEDRIALFGATLWTDIADGDPVSVLVAKNNMPDYHYTKNLTPAITMREHQETIKSLEEFHEIYKDYKKVVMTHHAPSFTSSAPQWIGHQLTPLFASCMDEFILNNPVEFHLHGHMHNQADYMIGTTRIINNPFGYARGEENPLNDPFLVIEV